MDETKRRRGRPATFDRAGALEAAVELFWRHGYDGTSISMLTEAMGVTPPTLYAAFGSKLGLYQEALARYRARERAASTKAGSVYEKLEAFLRDAARRFTASGSERGCMIATGSLRCGPDGEAAVAAAAQLRGQSLREAMAGMQAAKADGSLPADVDAEALARFYTAVVEGMAVQATDGASVERLNAVVDLALAAWPGSREPSSSRPRGLTSSSTSRRRGLPPEKRR